MNMEQVFESYDKNFNALVESDQVAKERGALVGRYVSEPFADGQAFYKVVAETKTKVKIEVVSGIGDDWVIPYWGSKATISKDYARKRIAFRDAMDEIFKKKREEKASV